MLFLACAIMTIALFFLPSSDEEGGAPSSAGWLTELATDRRLGGRPIPLKHWRKGDHFPSTTPCPSYIRKGEKPRRPVCAIHAYTRLRGRARFLVAFILSPVEGPARGGSACAA